MISSITIEQAAQALSKQTVQEILEKHF